jgi:siroheme synthase (precorrin-2 oxidase/ferrochelatase)
MPVLYPAFLKLDGLRVIVVGGGPVAAGKLDGLVVAGARVILIAPAICDEIRARTDIVRGLYIASESTPSRIRSYDVLTPVRTAESVPRTNGDVLASVSTAYGRNPDGWGSSDDSPSRANDSATDDPSRDISALEVPRGCIVLVERAFASPDLDSARWVVAAAPPEINQQVAAAATARGLFVNAVDDTSAATAYLGGVVRRGEVEIAISTGGAAPALAGLLREALDALIPDDVARWIDIAKQVRLDWKRDRVPMSERRPLLLRALIAKYRGAPAPEDHADLLTKLVDEHDHGLGAGDRPTDLDARFDHPPNGGLS